MGTAVVEENLPNASTVVCRHLVRGEVKITCAFGTDGEVESALRERSTGLVEIDLEAASPDGVRPGS